MASLLAQPRGPETSSLNTKELQAAISEASLILHCPPDFPKDAEVVGVCAVSDNLAGQSQYAWMVADFLGFKLAFYRVGHRDHQSWLSTLDVAQFIRTNTQAEIPEDCPIQTHILGRNNDHIVQISDTSKAVEDDLLEHIRLRARAANERKSTLVLMFFTPITSDQDICLDFQGEKIYLTTSKICDTIRKAVGHSNLPVVFMTPAPFTTGWMCRPALMGPLACTTDQAMTMIAKSCGSAFADGFMKRLIVKDTPLLSAEERKKAPYEILMPTSATAEQRELLHEFQERVYRSLKRKLSLLALDYTMRFEGFDAWEEYAARTGRPLSFWATRFSPFNAADDIDRFEFLGAAFGGTKASQLFHLRYMTTLELDTCPGDWSRGTTGMTTILFEGLFQTTNPPDRYVERVFDALEFRASSITLAQCVAKALGLPLPDNLKCRYWHDSCQPDGRPAYYANLQAAFGDTHNLFDLIAVSPREERHDFKVVRFFRSSRWLSAAVAQKLEDMSTGLLADSSAMTAKKVVLDDMAPRFEAIRSTQLHLLLQLEPIHRLGRSWLASIGLCNDLVVVLNKTKSRNSEAETSDPFTSTPRMDRVVRSASVLNPKAPEYRVVGPRVELKVQTPARENVPLGWTPMPPQIADKLSKPLAEVFSPENLSTYTPTPTGVKAIGAAKSTGPTKLTRAIEIKNPTEVQQLTEIVSPNAPKAPVNLMKLVHPVEFIKSVQSADTTKGPAPLEPIQSANSSIKLVDSGVKSADSGIKPGNNALKPGIEDEATKVLCALMSGGTSPELLAEVFKQALQLVKQRDVDAERAAARPETAAQVGGSSSFHVEQDGGSLSGGNLASTPAVPAEAEAVNNPTPPHSHVNEKETGNQNVADSADISTGLVVVHQNGTAANNVEATSSTGLCDGDDFWAKVKQYNRRRWA